MLLKVFALIAFSIVKSEHCNDATTNITHVIFDFDGTLIDSDNLYVRAIDSVTNVYGKNFTWRDAQQLNVTDVRKSSETLVNFYNLPITPDEFYTRVMNIFNKLISNLPLMPGAEKLIKHFKANRITMAICTSSDSKSFKQKTQHLGNFFRVGNFFDVIVTAKDDPEVKRMKPYPDSYLVTMSRFNPPPNATNVLSFEDTSDGMISATSAGTKCVLIKKPELCYDLSVFKPTFIIQSLEDFDPRLFCLPPF
ncbi:putative pseudouridine-5' [Dinothrombium tinctorium]|uniref:Putative pseudouridine-5 n=1 Tax=Dinothrombium tinctorium TaxID=1965070 RepID=A0A443QHA3_9ACAR|nr:putative pseudouridine-5' [Dinothrombium tinctorium]RWS02893.1 putative pseudouridine-5' [Dinothrombium tinctorium]